MADVTSEINLENILIQLLKKLEKLKKMINA